jgi:hypothetical protein
MKRISMAVASLAIVATTSVRLSAGEEIKAGMQPGDAPSGFNIKEVVGPAESDKGTSFCYTCRFGTKPVVNVFAKKVDKNVAALVKKLDDQLQKDEALKGYVVVLTEDQDATAAKLEEMWKSAGLKKMPLTTFEGMAGPKAYKINKNADVSVHLWNKRKVMNSFAFKSTDDIKADKIKEIVAAAKKLTAAEGVAAGN